MELKTVDGVRRCGGMFSLEYFFFFFNAMDIGEILTLFFRRRSDSNVNTRDSTLTQLDLVTNSNSTLVRLI